MGKQWKLWLTLFWGSKITADGDCSHDIKRRLLLGRKVMTNLDSIFKSRDITLSTKVHLVNAMGFPWVWVNSGNWWWTERPGVLWFMGSKKVRHDWETELNWIDGFSGSHVWMWELDYKESWVPKNWSFWNVVLKKILESPLDSKEIQPVHPKGSQSWIFFARTDAEAETPILWPPDGTDPLEKT